jgi:hypothetical protein
VKSLSASHIGLEGVCCCCCCCCCCSLLFAHLLFTGSLFETFFVLSPVLWNAFPRPIVLELIQLLLGTVGTLVCWMVVLGSLLLSTTGTLAGWLLLSNQLAQVSICSNKTTSLPLQRARPLDLLCPPERLRNSHPIRAICPCNALACTVALTPT